MAETPMTEATNVRELATGLEFPEGPVALPGGSTLVVETHRGTLSRVADGKVEVVADVGGGPNGAAIGPDGACYVVNNGHCFDWQDVMGMTFPGSPPPEHYPGRGSIQRVDLATGSFDTLYESCDGNPL